MSLVEDASATKQNSINSLLKGRIKVDVLQEMISDLNKMEIISIIFLMTDKETNVLQVIEHLKNDPVDIFTKLHLKQCWAEKLIEILIIIKNINIIKKLGFNEAEIHTMKKNFVCDHHNVTPNLNRVIKSLYFLCEDLTTKNTKELILKVNKQLKKPIEVDDNQIFLELYILYWLQQKYITIDEVNPNLDNLMKTLKEVGYLSDIHFDFYSWKLKNESRQVPQILKNDNCSQFVNNNNYNSNSKSNRINDDLDVLWRGDHKRLCIIINQINFKDEDNKTTYTTRTGSELDEKNLENTFKRCNFDIEVHRDLTKEKMIALLHLLNEQYSSFGCIFMCILSHGVEGSVVFSDNESIPIKVIEEMFCCENLQKTFKFIILQSCQGTQKGLLDTKKIAKISPATSLDKPSKLVTDGPSNPLCHLHFGLFQATINTYVAMRDECKGTWFIQDVCHELQISTPIKVTDWASKVIARVSARRNKFKDKYIVQVPRLNQSIPVDYLIPEYQKV